MKKIMLFATLFFLSTSLTFAKTTPSPTPSVFIAYELPYPGIVSTHPLYFLKNMRDGIIESLIRDPIKKVQFYILQADKKLQMALIVADDNKSSAADMLFAQAVAHRLQAVTILETLEETMPPHVVEKAALSLEKHKQIIQSRNLDTNSIQELLERVQKLL